MPKPARRNEAVGARIADVGLGRSELAERGARPPRRTAAAARHVGARRRMAGLGQQLADDPLGHRIIAFAEMVVADAARGHRRSSAPASNCCGARATGRNRCRARPGSGCRDPRPRWRTLVGIALEREFGRVDADDDQAVLAVAFVPRLHIGDRAQAIDAAVGPEVDHHDLALELLAGERRAVEPWADAVERRKRAFDRKHQLAHRVGPGAAVVHRRARAELSREAGFEARGLCARQLRKHPRVEAERDRADTDQHEHAEDLADALARAERLLHPREHLAADQQGERERGRGAERIGEQQQGGAEARALKRGGGEDDAEDRSGARRPQQAGRDPEDGRRPRCFPSRCRSGPAPTSASRARRAGRVRRSETCGNTKAIPNSASRISAAQRPTSLARTAQPPPTAASVATMAKVTAIPASKGRVLRAKLRSARANTNGRTGQDARADNGQHAAQIGKEDDQHGVSSGVDKRRCATCRSSPVG